MAGENDGDSNQNNLINIDKYRKLVRNYIDLVSMIYKVIHSVHRETECFNRLCFETLGWSKNK